MLRITQEIIKDTIFKIVNATKNNLMNIFWLATIVLPYVMYYIGQYVYQDRERFAIGGEIFIPVIIYIIAYYIKAYANKIGKGNDIPVPKNRFTNESEDGQVDVEYERVQELILYLNDLENYLERKGLM